MILEADTKIKPVYRWNLLLFEGINVDDKISFKTQIEKGN